MKKLSLLLFTSLVMLALLPAQRVSAQTANDTLRFGFFSDIHYGMTVYNGDSLYQDAWMRKALSGFLRRKAEFIFCGGDIVNASNDATQYAMFDNEMITPLPWYPMAGNHDIGADPAGVTMDKINAWNARGYGRGPNKREFYGFVLKNLGAFYVLNTQAYIATDLVAKARADSQLVEMDKFFTANESIPNKVVCSHVPLFTVSQTEDSAYFNIGPVYRKRIIDIMNKHNVHYYLAGHRHENAVVTNGGITVWANTALSFQLGSGNVRGYYIYTMTKNGLVRDFYPLTAEPVANKWKWIAYGDTRTNDVAHRSVLASIKAHTPDYRFMLNVGDCVEDGTNQSLWDVFQKACNDVLGGTGQTNTPPRYMAVPGNHEQMTLAGAIATWKYNMPGQQRYGNDGRCFVFDHENARFVLLDAEDSLTGKQLTLLNNAIKTNTQQWLFAMWHVPIFSFGDKAYDDSINKIWGKPLNAAGCDVIFTGHAHYYVRTQKVHLNGDKNPALDPANGTVHITDGTGGAPLRATITNYDNNEYMVAYRSDKDQAAYYGYTELDMDGDTMVLRHYSAAGVVMDSVVIKANPKGRAYKINRTVVGQGAIATDPVDTLFGIGASVQVKALPALGWQFVQWTGDLTGAQATDTLVMMSDKSITAQFQAYGPNLFEIRTTDVTGGTITRDLPGPAYTGGTKVTLTATPSAGQHFTGWTGDTTSSSPSLAITAWRHMQVTANFAPIQSYKVTTRTNSTMGSVTLSPAGGQYNEGTKVQVKATPAAGWTFYGWAGDLNGNKNPDSVAIDGQKEIRALYKKTGMSIFELPATEDTYIRGGIAYQGKNFNNDSCLYVREGTSTMNQARAFIKFDLSGVKGNVLAAWLKLHVRQGGLPDGPGVKASAFPVTDDSWSETLLKWTGAPISGTILDTAVTVSSMGMDYAIDVTSHIVSKMAGNKIASILVKDPNITDKGIQFDKREGTVAPTLVVATDQVTGVEAEETVPTEYRLYQNYPNPFNPSTSVTFTVPRKGNVDIRIFDMIGREIAVLQHGVLEAGKYSRVWNATNHSSGIYICRMTTSEKNEIIRMTLLK